MASAPSGTGAAKEEELKAQKAEAKKIKKEHKHTLYQIVLSDPIRVDEHLFQLWLKGFTVKQALEKRKIAIPPDQLPHQIVLLRDTSDQFRNFSLLEKCLQNPHGAQDALDLFISPSAVRQQLTEAYYTIDGSCIREFIGKKLKKSRSFESRSLTRQYRNLLRIYKWCVSGMRKLRSQEKDSSSQEGSIVSASEGKPSDEPVIDAIARHFCISHALASCYARLAFMSYHRLDTSKKRASSMSYADLDRVAQTMLSHWCLPSTKTLLLDDDFTSVVRDLKPLFLSGRHAVDRYLQLVSSSVGEKLSSTKLLMKFKELLKVLLQMAADLSRPNEFKDFIADMLELSVMFKRLGATESSVELFLNSLVVTFPKMLSTFHDIESNFRSQFSVCWERYIRGLSDMILAVYPLNI